MKTLSLWMCGLLLISLTGTSGLKHFPENFVVAKGNDANPVTLTCRTKTDGAVTWKFDGEVMEDDDFGENIQKNGRNLTVSEVDTPMLGEYSCWRGKEMLSSTYLLLEAEKVEESDLVSISCRAKSYDCNFSCDWTHRGQTAVRLGLGRDCSEGRKSCHWVSSDQLVDGRFHFELSHSLSPHAEESTMLELTAEAIVDLSILRTTRRFYLRDIVQPDSPQIVKCQVVGENLNVTIEAPASWSSPHSFFSLEHEIEYVLRDDGKTGRSSSALIPKAVSRLRVRSRDPLVLSAWSQWTPWENASSCDEIFHVPADGYSELEDREIIQGQVVLVERGGCSFVQKTRHVEEAGGKAALNADNAVDNDVQYLDMITDGSTAKPSIPVLFLLGRDGMMMIR